MIKLSVVPSNPKKITKEEHDKYLAARKALKNYEQTKEKLKDFTDVVYANSQLKTFIKQYRQSLRDNEMKYELSYSLKNKAWAKLIPEIKHSFNRNIFYSSSIIKNKKHEAHHKDLFKKELLTRSDQIQLGKEKIKQQIQEQKHKLRTLRLKSRRHAIKAIGDTINYNLCGGVIHDTIKSTSKVSKNKSMGVFMRFLKSKEKRIVFDQKNPDTTDNYIGIEIEFSCDLDQQDLAFVLYEAGLHKNACLKTDGSVKAEGRDQHPHELCLLGKEKEIFDLIQRTTKVLADCNAKVNKSCGMHVHLDMRNRNVETVFNNLVCSQNILFAMNPYSRQTGTFCRRIDTKDFDLAKKSGSRYYGINAASHAKHKTIEIRIHSGTIMERKISNWVKLLLTITNKKEVIKKASASLKQFISSYDIDSELASYIAERMNKFVGEENKEVEERGAA